MIAVIRFCSSKGFRPDRALVDPAPENANLFGRKGIALLRHPGQLVMRAGGEMDNQALGAVARDHRRAVISTLQSVGLQIEAQSGLLLFRSVTLVTAIGQQRLDVLREIDRSRRHRWQLG